MRVPINILVLEDHPKPRQLVLEYLAARLHRHGHQPSPDAPDFTGTDDPRVHHAGSLSHILVSGWGPHGSCDYCVASPKVEATLDVASQLASAEASAEDRAALCEFPDQRAADVMIVDLALSDEEERGLKRAGGNRRPRETTEGWVWDDPDDTGGDPLSCLQISELQKLTGYRVLEAHAGRGPIVIVTSYARNPLVRKRCLEDGAFAYIEKPFRGFEMWFAKGFSLEYIDQLADERGQEPRIYAFQSYLLALSAEVLKATVKVGVAALPEHARVDPVFNARRRTLPPGG